MAFSDPRWRYITDIHSGAFYSTYGKPHGIGWPPKALLNPRTLAPFRSPALQWTQIRIAENSNSYCPRIWQGYSVRVWLK
jgi:hypothetical protein